MTAKHTASAGGVESGSHPESGSTPPPVPATVSSAAESSVMGPSSAESSVMDTRTAPVTPWMEKAVAIVTMAFGLAMIAGARSIELRNETEDIDPRFWPIMVGGGIVAAGGWMTFNAFTARRIGRDVEVATRTGWRQLLATIAVLIGTITLWNVGISFLWLAPAFLIVLNLVFGIRSIRGLVAFPALMWGFIYVVFSMLLKVPL